ncbi:MAG TPA: hypothetical protein VJU61_05155, partial [Polyangiaceae bacterium]|nr:hypothetical protein [Polyangiaceae bacterium]
MALLRYIVVAALTGFAIKLAQLAESQGEVWAKQLWDLLREASSHLPNATLNLALLLLNVGVGVKLYLGFRAQRRAVSLQHWALLSSGFYVLYALSAWLNKSIVLEGFWAAATDATYALMTLCILNGIMPRRRIRRWAIAG